MTGRTATTHGTTKWANSHRLPLNIWQRNRDYDDRTNIANGNDGDGDQSLDRYTSKDIVNEHADSDDTTRTMLRTMSKAMAMMNNETLSND